MRVTLLAVVSLIASVTLSLIASATVAFADPPETSEPDPETEPAAAQPPVRTLSALMHSALAHWPGVSAAQHRVAAADARLTEAWVSPFFQLTATGSFALVPGARGTPVFSPDPQLPLSNSWGPAGAIRVEGAIPIFTFGKLDAAREAARAGIRVAESDVSRVRDQVRFDVRRAYYALELALDAEQMISEGRTKLDQAVARLQERIDADDPDVNEMDRWRMAGTLAEVDGRQSEAMRLHQVSYDALSILSTEQNFSLPDCAMTAIVFELRALAYYQDTARDHRPEAAQLMAAIAARDASLSLTRAQYFPDIAVALSAGYSRTPGVTDQSNPFVQDPGNTPTLGAALVARWSMDLWGNSLRVRRAREELYDAHDRAEEARSGMSIEVANIYEELRDARRREETWGRGHRETRAWFLAAAQAYQIGAAEPRDLVDALRAYFMARFSHIQAIHDTNVATAKLEKAVGVELIPESQWDVVCPP